MVFRSCALEASCRSTAGGSSTASTAVALGAGWGGVRGVQGVRSLLMLLVLGLSFGLRDLRLDGIGVGGWGFGYLV